MKKVENTQFTEVKETKKDALRRLFTAKRSSRRRCLQRQKRFCNNH